jgi:acyl-CoA thioesterase-1
MNTFLKIVAMAAALLLPCPAHAAETILVFGDSLSAGYGIARETSWASLLKQELEKHQPRYEVVNASISGETTAGGLRRIEPALEQHHPRIVILELGANDGLRGAPIPETEKNLDHIIRQIRETGAKVLLLGIQLPPNYGQDYTRRFRVMYPSLAKRHKVTLLPFMLDGIPPEQFQADNLHPNAEAQPRIMRNILHHLQPLLR